MAAPSSTPRNAAFTRVLRVLHAPRPRIYRALTTAEDIARWMAPDGMRIHIHHHDAREGGAFRVSLTYTASDAKGKSSDHTDTYHGQFQRLVPHTLVEETMEFESADPAMQGPMRLVFTLRDVKGGTELQALHQDLPPGVAEADNAEGWRMSLDKLAALVEHPQPG